MISPRISGSTTSFILCTGRLAQLDRVEVAGSSPASIEITSQSSPPLGWCPVIIFLCSFSTRNLSRWCRLWMARVLRFSVCHFVFGTGLSLFTVVIGLHHPVVFWLTWTKISFSYRISRCGRGNMSSISLPIKLVGFMASLEILVGGILFVLDEVRSSSSPLPRLL